MTFQCNSVHFSAIQYISVQFSTLQYIALQFSISSIHLIIFQLILFYFSIYRYNSVHFICLSLSLFVGLHEFFKVNSWGNKGKKKIFLKSYFFFNLNFLTNVSKIPRATPGTSDSIQYRQNN